MVHDDSPLRHFASKYARNLGLTQPISLTRPSPVLRPVGLFHGVKPTGLNHWQLAFGPTPPRPPLAASITGRVCIFSDYGVGDFRASSPVFSRVVDLLGAAAGWQPFCVERTLAQALARALGAKLEWRFGRYWHVDNCGGLNTTGGNNHRAHCLRSGSADWRLLKYGHA